MFEGHLTHVLDDIWEDIWTYGVHIVSCLKDIGGVSFLMISWKMERRLRDLVALKGL